MWYGESIEESCLPINVVHQINEHNHWHDSDVNLSPQLLLDLELLWGERSKMHDFITSHASFIAEDVMVEDDLVYMIELLVAHVGLCTILQGDMVLGLGRRSRMKGAEMTKTKGTLALYEGRDHLDSAAMIMLDTTHLCFWYCMKESRG